MFFQLFKANNILAHLKLIPHLNPNLKSFSWKASKHFFENIFKKIIIITKHFFKKKLIQNSSSIFLFKISSSQLCFKRISNSFFKVFSISSLLLFQDFLNFLFPKLFWILFFWKLLQPFFLKCFQHWSPKLYSLFFFFSKNNYLSFQKNNFVWLHLFFWTIIFVLSSFISEFFCSQIFFPNFFKFLFYSKFFFFNLFYFILFLKQFKIIIIIFSIPKTFPN